MAGNKRVMLMLATVVLAAVSGVASAKSFVVGGSTGWTIPPSPSFYSSWASKQTLQVGDVLVFNFPASAHTVAEVSKANYDACTAGSTIGPVMTTAPSSITITKPGTHYFICTITGHCSAGQKLTVTTAASSAATPAPAPARSTKKTPTPTASPAPAPARSTKKTPTPTASPATSPATAPAAVPISSPAATPATAVAPSTTGTVSPAGAPSVPSEVSGPAGSAGAATPPAGNSAASTGVTILSLVSVVAAALVF